MERRTISLRDFRRLALVTTTAIGLLVVAGGVVRLTGSGLGCDDWPNCNSERFVDVSSGHAAIEQVNRIFSGLIGVPTLLLAVAAFRVRPPTRGLRVPALGVLLTVLANGVVGGLAVRGDLHPVLVQSHFLLAMASIAFGVVAIGRADPERNDPASRPVRGAVTALGVLTALALVTGTVVTGTGPHAGDEDVRRLGLDISSTARVHSVVVIVAIVCSLGIAWRLRRDGVAGGSVGRLLSTWVFLGLLQGGVGYTQYFNGVPEVLVGVHIALATLLWAVTVRIVETARGVRARRSPTGTIADRVPAPA